jgi:hypothetical protein
MSELLLLRDGSLDLTFVSVYHYYKSYILLIPSLLSRPPFWNNRTYVVQISLTSAGILTYCNTHNMVLANLTYLDSFNMYCKDRSEFDSCSTNYKFNIMGQ